MAPVITIAVIPGEKIDIPATQAELANAAFELIGANLQITLPDGRQILLVGYVDAFDGPAPIFALADGSTWTMEDALAAMGETLEDIQAAAGRETGPQAGTEAANQQASFTEGPTPTLLGSLIDKGPVDPTALRYGVPELLDDQEEFIEEEGQGFQPLEWRIDPDSSVTEGEFETYTVSYNGGPIGAGETVLVTVDAQSGTADEGPDFSEISPTVLTFVGGGATAQTVEVETVTDTAEEPDETYTANITGVGDGVIADGTATTTIIDNTALQWEIEPDSSVDEGQAETYSVFFTSGSIAPGETVFVTVDASSGSALEGADFSSFAPTVLTFTSGQTLQTVQVQTVADSVEELDETYTVNITDVSGGGTIVDGTATTTIVDDDGVPTATDNVNGGPEASILDSNIIIVFDRSGSMNADPGVDGFSTRLDLAKAAVSELLKLAEAGGGSINVFVVDFSFNANNSGWTTVDGAIAYLSALIADDATDYDAALAEVTGNVLPIPSSDQTLLYFLSDGLPTDDNGTGTNGIVGAEVTAWESFVDTNNIVAHAIGIGEGVDEGNLAPIAYNGVTGTQIDPIVVADSFDELSNTLSGTLGSSFTGNVLTDDDGFGVDSFGPNGAPASDKIANVAVASQSGFSLVFTVAAGLVGDLWTITGSNAGDDYWKLELNDETGAYSFTVLRDLPITGAPGSIVFDYTIEDADGNPDTEQLIINLTDVPAASRLPTVFGDETANNLTGPGDISQIFGGDDGNDTIAADGGADYAYGGDGDDTIDGGEGDDVLVGGVDDDSMSGGNGNDLLAGTNGNDTLDGGEGADTLDGGPGDDDFRWNAASEFGDSIIDFTSGSDGLVFDVSAGTIAVGDNDDSVEGYFEGTLATANLDGRDVIVITNDGLTDPLSLINSGSFDALDQGTIFVIEDSNLGASGTAVVYYDADPSVAGGATVVTTLDNVTDISPATFASGDFEFA